MDDIAHIRRSLAGHTPTTPPPGDRRQAGVALVLAPTDEGLSVLLIQRSLQEGDPWSGQLGFPGGTRDPEDPDLFATAVRESTEELGLTLDRDAEHLGRLGTIVGRPRPLEITIHAFFLAATPPLEPNPAEVASAFWVPLSSLLDPARRTRFVHPRLGTGFPALRLFDPPTPVLWGMTYEFLRHLLMICGRDELEPTVRD